MASIGIRYHKSSKLWLKLFICFTIFIFVNVSLKAEDSEFFKVEYVGTNGNDINDIDQIIVQFNKSVVPFNDNSQTFDLPVKVDPRIDCKWNWINSTILVCHFRSGSRLKLATTYTVTLDNTLKALDGALLEGEKKFTFSTLRPDVTNVLIHSWKDYGKPVLQVDFNQFIKTNGIEDLIYIIPENPDLKNKKYKVRLLNEKNFLSEDTVDSLNKEFQGFFANENNIFLEKTKKIVFLETVDNLPRGEKFKLILGEDLKSAHGGEKNIGLKEVLNFHSFDKPKFLGVSCYSHSGGKYGEIKISTGIKYNGDNGEKCLPEKNINFIFSAPITVDTFKDYLKFNPQVDIDFTQNDSLNEIDSKQLKKFNYKINSDGNYQISVNKGFPPNQKINLQPNFKENQGLYERIKKWFTFKWSSQKRIFDVFGGILNQNFDFSFMTDHYKPQIFFPNHNDLIVLEKSTKDDLEIPERNFEDIQLNCNILSSNLNSKNQIFTKELDLSSQDTFLQIPLGVREILGGRSGLIFGKLSAHPIDLTYPILKSNFAIQVTNFGIIAKISHYNSLVFVTDLTNGNVIKNAKVKLYKSKLPKFNTDEAILITIGRTDENGIAILSFDENLKNQINSDNNFIIQIEKDDEMAWLSLRYGNLILFDESQNIKPYHAKNHLLTWGFTNQGIYKPNNIVKYKIFVTNNDSNQVIKVEDINYKLRVISKTGKIVYEENDVKLSEFGSVNGYFKIKEDIEPGYYEILLIPNLKSWKEDYEGDLPLYSTKFFVESYKIPQFKIQTEIDKEKLLNGDELRIKSFCEPDLGILCSDTKLNSNINLEAKIFTLDSKLEDFSFYDSEESERVKDTRISTTEDKLDENGELIKKFKLENHLIPFGELSISTSVHDKNKEIILSKKKIKYFGVDRFVGVKLLDWPVRKDRKSIFNFVVVDIDGKLINDIDVNLRIEKEESNISQNLPTKNTWKLIESCTKKSLNAENSCEFIFSEVGNYKVTATALDSKGRIHKASQKFIVVDNEINLSEKVNGEVEIISEKEKYNVGDRARFIIKNPLIGANALITFEREGILKQFVKKFNKPFEIVEFDLGEKDAPGFYLSVVLTRQRISNNQDKSTINPNYTSDLYKPTTKIGYSKISVQDLKKKLKINISADKENYKPADDVQLTLKLSDDSQIDEVETTILIVDDNMIDLISNGIDYFNPNIRFSTFQDLGITNYSLFKTTLSNIGTIAIGNMNQENNSDLHLGSNFEGSVFEDNFILHKDEVKKIYFKLPNSLINWRVIVVMRDKNSLFGMENKLLRNQQQNPLNLL